MREEERKVLGRNSDVFEGINIVQHEWGEDYDIRGWDR